jgi:hypothetical protein
MLWLSTLNPRPSTLYLRLLTLDTPLSTLQEPSGLSLSLGRIFVLSVLPYVIVHRDIRKQPSDSPPGKRGAWFRWSRGGTTEFLMSAAVPRFVQPSRGTKF